MAFINQCFLILCSIIVHVLVFFTSQPLARPLDEHNDLSMRDQHEQWMAEYGRTYKDLVEKEKRFNIFKENVEYIENFNNNSSSSNHKLYTLGVNEFADLTTEEFMATYAGSKVSPSESIFGGSTTTYFKYENITNAPPSMDWREKGAVTPIKNQRRCGGCWAFAALAAVEALNKIKTGNLISLSEQEILDCDKTNKGCKGGHIRKTFTFIQQHQGILPEQVYPYRGWQGQCQTPQGTRVTIDGYEVVPAGNEDALMQAVSEQPVTVRLNIRGAHLYRGGIYNGACDAPLNHAVAVIGYGTENGNKYWLVKNSWGTRFGENGFMRLIRGSNICGIANAAAYPVHKA